MIKGHNEKHIQLLLEAAIKGGHGTEEHRSTVKEWLAGPEKELKLREDQLKLSSGRLVHANESGHDVHLTEPEIIAEEVKWILSVTEEWKTCIN